MRRLLILHTVSFCVLVLAVGAVHAGEPIPDIDVILEQNPGATLVKTSRESVADEVLIEVPRAWLDQPEITEVPVGWTASVSLGKRRAVMRLVRCDARARDDGASVARMLGRAPRDVVPGRPCVADDAQARRGRPMKVSFGRNLGTIGKGVATVEALRDGRVLARVENVDLEVLPPVVTAGTLSGLVHLPPTVSPGETVTAQVDPERLPPSGTWTLSGVVLDEAPADEAAPEPSTVHLESAGPSLERALHQTSKSVIRDLRVVAPIAVEEEGSNIAIKEEGVNVSDPGAPGEGIAIKEGGVNVATGEVRDTEAHVEGETGFAITEETMPVETFPPATEASLLANEDPSRPVQIIRLDPPASLAGSGLELWAVAPAVGSCRPVGGAQVAVLDRPAVGGRRQLTMQPCATEGSSVVPEAAQFYLVGSGVGEAPGIDLDAVAAALLDASLAGGDACGTAIVRMAAKRPPGATRGPRGETVAFGMPADLPVGVPLEVGYEDEWGRPLLDVPAAEGVEVVPPPEGDRPALTDGTRVAVSGTTACACGRFPTRGAQTGLVFGDLALDRPLAASGSSIRFEVPPSVPLGPHEVLGDPSRGFAAGDGFPVDVIRIDAELDQNELLRGGSTTIRLVVVGTELPVRVEVINKSPSVIAIDGGDRQVVETAGGGDNSAVRNVRATGKGAFDIGWSLALGNCPCGSP